MWTGGSEDFFAGHPEVGRVGWPLPRADELERHRPLGGYLGAPPLKFFRYTAFHVAGLDRRGAPISRDDDARGLGQHGRRRARRAGRWSTGGGGGAEHLARGRRGVPLSFIADVGSGGWGMGVRLGAEARRVGPTRPEAGHQHVLARLAD